MILLIDKVLEKTQNVWRKALIKKKSLACADDVKVYGKIYLINRNITIGKNVKIFPGVMFFGDGPIILGDNVSIGNNTMIYASKNGGVTIGDNTSIAAMSYIIDCDHGVKAGTMIKQQNNICSPINIGTDVWIAANCCILKGANISDGAVVGAKALVKGNIETNSIVVGIPAKEIKKRR